MANNERVNILRDLGELEARDLNTIILAAHAYRAGFESGRNSAGECENEKIGGDHECDVCKRA